MSSTLLQVRCEQIGDQIVVHPVGEVDLTTAPLLHQALGKATAVRGARQVVVDLTEVGFFGAVGLTVLLAATRHGDDIGVSVLVVADRGQPAHRTITITDMQHELTLVDSLPRALIYRQLRHTTASIDRP